MQSTLAHDLTGKLRQQIGHGAGTVTIANDGVSGSVELESSDLAIAGVQ